MFEKLEHKVAINLKKFINYFLFLNIFLTLNAAHASNREFIQQLIHDKVAEKLTDSEDSRFKIKVSNIDSRIAIKPCSKPLDITFSDPAYSRSFSAQVRCNSEQPWKMYVPVRVYQAKAVLVTKSIIARDSVIQASDLAIEYVDVNKLRGQTYRDSEPFVGAKAKRRIAAGTAITPKNICFICKGDQVTLIAKSNEFSIKTDVVAQEDGFIGEQINVKNKKSGRMVAAKVNSVNNVVINL